jgi:hypothetical protein
MKETIVNLDKFITKGLAKNKNPRNNPLLSSSIGAMVYEGSLCADQDLITFQIDLSAYAPIYWPYPQLFTLSDNVVICLETKILELQGNNVVPVLTGLPVGYPWTLLDFHSYIYLSNGVVAVTRNPQTLAYAVDTTVPKAMAACDFNGQVLLGGTPFLSSEIPTIT